MQTLYVTVHPGKPAGAQTARRLLGLLAARGLSCCVEPWLSAALEMHPPALPIREGVRVCDALISLGGDGTLLRAMPHAARAGIPVLGVNLGRVGFLTEAEPAHLSQAIDALKAGDYAVEERMLLAVSQAGEEELLVLNDVAAGRGGQARVVTVTVLTQSDRLCTYTGDGVVISTPVGSTGYALSAGGPLIAPDVRCMLVTPLCTRALHQRPVVVSDDTVLTLRADPGLPVHVTFDGQSTRVLAPGETLTIRRAAACARLIRLSPARFFTRLRQKHAAWSEE